MADGWEVSSAPYNEGGDSDANIETLMGDIIPGLPNDLAINCLARLSHGYHGILECVSKTWQTAVRSSHYSKVKARLGFSGNWLFVLTEDSLLWEAYDPEAERWHTLPIMPRPMPNHMHIGFSCVALSEMFLVLGGYYAKSSLTGDVSVRSQYNKDVKETSSVMVFNPLRKMWGQAAYMQLARSFFACAAIGGKVYVAGGAQGNQALAHAEVYDPTSDRWMDLPPMPFPLMECFGFAHGGKFHVVGQKDSSLDYSEGYVNFNPTTGNWQVVEEFCPLDRLTRTTLIVERGHILCLTGEGTVNLVGHDIRNYFVISEPPKVLLPHHDRKVRPFGYALAVLQHRLYILGGKALRYDGNYHIEKLPVAISCDATVRPFVWKAIPPMRHSCGTIVGCASLQEGLLDSQ